ncbi:MAG TPA: FliG C-terminal domain-containing protein [Isosphaeraceae bacterium]|nr:FliG C-terminal domain-containing protein [Isosphaeraceae bacterium]
MSDLVDFEDLGLLDGHDLRAVLDQVPDAQVLEALVGTPTGLRHSLLTKLSPASATRLEAQIASHGPVPFEAVQTAQRALVEALCRLSRGGQVAFDDPEDMVA